MSVAAIDFDVSDEEAARGPDADSVGASLADEYRATAISCFRGRGELNAAMVAFLEGRGGSLEDFEAWGAAHRILGQKAADALQCWAAVVGAEGIA